MLTLFVLAVFSSNAFALSSAQKAVLQNGIYYFNTESSGSSCSATVDVNLSGNDNVEKAYNFFVSQGLTAARSAGIVGNFKWESGVDPTKKGGGGDSDTPTDTWGIAQWTQGSGRLTKLEDYAKQNNENIDDLATQLGFAWSEIKGGPVLA